MFTQLQKMSEFHCKIITFFFSSVNFNKKAVKNNVNFYLKFLIVYLYKKIDKTRKYSILLIIYMKTLDSDNEILHRLCQFPNLKFTGSKHWMLCLKNITSFSNGSAALPFVVTYFIQKIKIFNV